MNSSSPSLARLIATAFLIVLGGSFQLANAATPSTPIPDIASSEVTRAFDRLTTENDQRVTAAIDSSMAVIGAEASDAAPTLAAPSPAHRFPHLRVASDFRRIRAYHVRG